jgi:N-acetylglutamate synthase-like GNAT family acetyltransferase
MIQIEFLKYNNQFINELAQWHFLEWGYLRVNSTVQRYIDVLDNNLNDDKIPFTIIAKSERGKLIGSASLVDFDMENNNDMSPWLSGVFVVPDQRGKGFGKLIVTRLEEIAKDIGLEKLYLFTFDTEEFYKKLSWKTVKNDFYLNWMVTIMSKDL